MATRNATAPTLAPPLSAVRSALDNPTAAKCRRALALLEEAWELVHDVLDDAGERGEHSPEWQAKIPAVLPECSVEPLREAICAMRPPENFPPGSTRAEMEASAEADDSYRH